jgi:hypothetical protein
MQWWFECLWEEKIGQISWQVTWTPTSAIFEAYELWARKSSPRVLHKLEFGRRMAHRASAVKPAPKRINGEVVRCWELRDLDDARRAFDVEMGTLTDWPDASGVTQPPLIP